MTPAQLASHVRFRTKTDATTFENSDMMLITNMYIEKIGARLAEEGADELVQPFVTNLVADQREYPYPDRVIKVKALEVNLTGEKKGWKRVKEVDLNTYRTRYYETGFDPLNLFNGVRGYATATTDEEAIIENFSDDRPMYDITRRAINLRTGSAIINVTNGLKFHGYVHPDPLTDMTDNTNDISTDPSQTSFGLPKAFHEHLVLLISAYYKSSEGIPLKLDEQQILTYYQGDFNDVFSRRNQQNTDNEIFATTPNFSIY